MATIAPEELVERIWERDPTVWTGADEAQWLGWLDEPLRTVERTPELAAFADEAADEFAEVVLLGVGAASIPADVLRRVFLVESFHVLDTTHPRAIRSLEDRLDLGRTLFLASSKSGAPIETLSQLEYFWERTGRRARQFAVVTDPGSPFEDLARERGFRAVFHGEPTVGGAFGALSVSGVVPAALMGVDLERLLGGAAEMAVRCRSDDANAGLALGLELTAGAHEGRDKVVVTGELASWVEHLLAEATGKEGQGLVPAPDESPDGADRQPADARLGDPYDLGAEVFRWQFGAAVAAAVLGVNPFDRPDVHEARDLAAALLTSAAEPSLEPEGSADELLAAAEPGDYVCVQAFVEPTPAAQERLVALVERVRRRTGCVVTGGYGPGYLHATGQLHKGGPPSGIYLQVVDDVGPELAIPGRPFGFGRLLRAQAAGDLAALRERGRRVARLRLEDL